MTFPFYKKFSIQTKNTQDKIEQVFTNLIKKPESCEEIRKLMRRNSVQINYINKHFQIAIKPKTLWFERQGMPAILKGKINEKLNGNGSDISMFVRPSNEPLFSFGLIYFLLSMALVYGVSKNITQLIIISSILLLFSFVLTLLDFNWQVKRYERIINSFFEY